MWFQDEELIVFCKQPVSHLSIPYQLKFSKSQFKESCFDCLATYKLLLLFIQESWLMNNLQ